MFYCFNERFKFGVDLIVCPERMSLGSIITEVVDACRYNNQENCRPDEMRVDLAMFPKKEIECLVFVMDLFQNIKNQRDNDAEEHTEPNTVV